MIIRCEKPFLTDEKTGGWIKQLIFQNVLWDIVKVSDEPVIERNEFGLPEYEVEIEIHKERKQPLITTIEDLQTFLANTFFDISFKTNKFGELVVNRKGAKKELVFHFNNIDSSSQSAADRFIGHICLSFGYNDLNHLGGGGYMEVADERSLEEEIKNFVNEHLKVEKIERKEEPEQLNLFDFQWE